MFAKTTTLGKSEWDELKKQTLAAGLKAPYLVLMGWNADQDREALGFDAISEYACAGKGYTTDPETYARLTSHHVRVKLWEKWRRERTPCITFATAGWDTRPRQERPPPWCSWVKATPDPTPSAQQKPLIDAATATPDDADYCEKVQAAEAKLLGHYYILPMIWDLYEYNVKPWVKNFDTNVDNNWTGLLDMYIVQH